MKGFLQNGDSEIAKSPHSLIKDDHVLNSHIGILQQTSPSKPYILLSKHLRKSSDIIDYSEIAKIIPFRHQRWPCTKQPFWNFSTNIFFQTIYSFEKKLMEGFQQYGDLEIAKLTPFTYQRWSCTIQPSWNSSTTIFQTIYSLAQKLDGRLPTT